MMGLYDSVMGKGCKALLHLLIGRKNAGKTYRMYERIKAAATEDQKVFLRVPDQFSFESERQMLFLLGEKQAERVEVCSFSRLAETVVPSAGVRKLTDAGRVAFMSLALEETQGELEVYGRFASSMGVVAEMLKVSDELKQCAVTAEKLIEASYKTDEHDLMLGKKLRDIAKVTSAYDALVAQSYFDERDWLTLLAERLPEAQIFADSLVFVDGFKGFTEQEMKILACVMEQAQDVFVTLCTDELFGDDYDISPFACVRATAKRLMAAAKKGSVAVKCETVEPYAARYAAPALAKLEQLLYSFSEEVFEEPTDAITVCSASSAYDECDYVALAIKKLLRSGQYRCREIAVIARQEGSYSKALRAAMKKQGIPVFDDKRRPLLAQPLAVLLRAALEIAARGFSSDAVFRLLKTQLAGLNVEETGELEDYVSLWQIDGRRWTEEWKQNPSGLGCEMRESDRQKLAELNALRVRCVAPLIALRAKLQQAQGSRLIAELYHYLIAVHADENLKRFAAALNESGSEEEAIECGTVWDQMMELLDQMAVAVSTGRMGAKRLLELFTLVLSVQDVGVIPKGLDEVTIGSADRVRLNRPKVVFAVGVNEGVFPLTPSAGRVLNDADRRILIDLGVTVTEPSRYQYLEERFLAYSTLCSPSEKLFVTYCRSDFGGAEASASELALQLQTRFPRCERLDFSVLPLIDKVESAAGAFGLAAQHWQEDTVFESTLRAALTEQDGYRTRMTALDRLNEPNRLDIKDPATARKMFDDEIRVSATRIEDFEKCPFLFYCRHGLGLKEKRKAEIDPMLGGTIIHYVLENLVKSAGSGLERFSDEQIQAEVDRWLKQFLQENMVGFEEQGERFRYQYDRLSKTVCLVVQKLRRERQLSDFEPTDFELPIGQGEDGIPAFEIPIPDGGKMVLNGKVDRVDTLKSDSGTFLRVLDYKTGKKAFDLCDVLSGLNMQMLLYLFAIEENGGGRYGKVIPSGVLYVPAKNDNSAVARSVPEEEIRQKMMDDAKMTGLVLNDERVVHATDKTEGGKAVIRGRRGVAGSLIDAADLNRLKQAVCAKVGDMGLKLHEGKVSACPVRKGGSVALPCDYCAYGEVCLHRETDEQRLYEKEDFAACIAKLREGEDHAEMDD